MIGWDGVEGFACGASGLPPPGGMFPISRRSTWLAEKADAIKEALCTGVLAHDAGSI